MSALCVIPARGGSKRIPRKNIKPFHGAPILTWPLRAAQSSGLFDTVMVSTEDDEIAAVAERAGAVVPFRRSAATADDHATLLDVMAEVVAGFDARGFRFETVCCLLPTAALVRAEQLVASFTLFRDGGYDSVFPVVRFPSPIQRALRRGEDGATAMIRPEHYRSRSQDLEPAFFDPGLFYWMRADAIRAGQGTFEGKAGSFEVSALDVQDIDSAEDWALAELKWTLQRGKAA